MRRIPVQRHRKYLQQSHRSKFFQSRECHAKKCTRSLQKTIHAGQKIKDIIIKTPNIQYKERVLRPAKEETK